MQNLHLTFLRIILIAFLLLSFTGGVDGQEIDHWETIVETGQSVKYICPESDVPSDWITGGFDDSGWTDGIAGIGYGDNDDNTIIDACLSVYIRTRFTITDLTVIDSLILDMDFDDGFVAYLNGEEIARENMGDAYSATTWNQSSDGIIDEQAPGYYRYPLKEEDLSTLVTGVNILCVEVHNQAISSSDLSSNTWLSAGINNSNSYFNDVPEWFFGYAPFASTMPVMVINTNGQNIVDEPRIVVDMGLIYNGYGEDNFPTDSFNLYDGKMSIEIRGNTSSNFAKRPYRIELQTDSGTNNNVSLLGLPRENDFILNGPYSDKSLLRNVINFEVYRAMGHWAPRTRLIDLYLNDDYRGVYVLMEKIKIDKYRVADKQLTATDLSPSEISGGYILQVDRTGDLESDEFWNSSTLSYSFEYYDPKRDELTNDQADYVKNYVENLGAIFSSSNYKDPVTGYRPLIDVASFVDYYLLHEFNKDVDAYRLSTYFYKASDSLGGKLHAGPPWDYNLTLGNADYGKTWDPENWEGVGSKYWWPKLVEDPYFKNKAICRWNHLHDLILNETFLFNLIDEKIELMGTSIENNFEKFPILGVDIWPNFFVGDTYEEEIAFLKDWISIRVNWIDAQWGGKCVPDSREDVLAPLISLTISPNPSDLSHTRIQMPDHQAGAYSLSVYDINGRKVYNSEYVLDQYSGNIYLEDISYLNRGIYLLRIIGEGKLYSGKIIRE